MGAYKEEKGVSDIPKSPEETLRLVTELDEELFHRKYGKRSTATDTDEYRGNADIGDPARDALLRLSDEEIDALKSGISILRKYTCLFIMQFIKREGDWEDEL